MKNKIYTLLFATILLVASGCSKWLDVKSKSEIDSESLFSAESGFRVVINGIYVNLSSEALYGGDLSYGIVDLLARYYDADNQLGEAIDDYNLSDPNVVGPRMQNVWLKLYNTIINANELIEQIDSKSESFFTLSSKSCYKAEAIAARAYCYFTLVRLFTPAIIHGDSKILPYKTDVSQFRGEITSTLKILDNIKADLQLARELLFDIDHKTTNLNQYANESNRFTGSVDLKSVGNRFNYYSVTAILSRVALYSGDNNLALQCAQEVMDEKGSDNKDLVIFTSINDISKDKHDQLLSWDVLQMFYYKKLNERYPFILGPNTKLRNMGHMYPSDSEDKRVKLIENSALIKYKLFDDRTAFCKLGANDIPVIRLSELYYIKAEVLASNGKIDEANEALKMVVKARGVTNYPYFSTKEDLMNYLIEDARKEFVGEGQMFFMYKRLNIPVRDEKYGDKALSKDQTYFPVPDSEKVG